MVLGDFCVVTGSCSGISSSRVAFFLGLVGLVDVCLVFLDLVGVGCTAVVVPLWSPWAVGPNFFAKVYEIFDIRVNVSDVKPFIKNGSPWTSLLELFLETLSKK